MVAEKHSAEFAHHVAQMPYDERKLYWWNDLAHGVKNAVVTTYNHGAKFVKNEVNGHIQAVKGAYNQVKKHAVTLYQKARVASYYITPIVHATIRDVKKQMVKAKHAVDGVANKIKHELKKVPSAVKKSVDAAVKKTMKNLKYSVDRVSSAVKLAAPELHAAASSYVNNQIELAKKVGGLVVSVGNKMYQVTVKALKAAQKFVNEKLIPWLREHIDPIWQSAKKKALKLLKDQTGIDTNKEFHLKFDTSKLSAKVILKGLANVAIITAEDSANEFMMMLPSELPWLTSTLGLAAVVNAPVCIGAASLTIATAGVGSPSIAACAMGVSATVAPQMYTKLTAMGLTIALAQAPQILGRLADEFCPKIISGNGALLLCKGISKLTELDPRKGLKKLAKIARKKLLKGKRRRAQQVSSKRRRLSVLTASHD